MTTRDIRAIAFAREASISGRAAEIRRELRLSQAELAALVGVSRPSISRWEAGLCSPRGKAALRYGHVLRSLERPATNGQHAPKTTTPSSWPGEGAVEEINDDETSTAIPHVA